MGRGPSRTFEDQKFWYQKLFSVILLFDEVDRDLYPNVGCLMVDYWGRANKMINGMKERHNVFFVNPPPPPGRKKYFSNTMKLLEYEN